MSSQNETERKHLRELRQLFREPTGAERLEGAERVAAKIRCHDVPASTTEHLRTCVELTAEVLAAEKACRQVDDS